MSDYNRPISLEAERDPFSEHNHMCLIYDDDEQRKKIMSQFVADGLAAGASVCYFADTTPLEEVRSWGEGVSVNSTDEGKDSAFQLYSTESIYYPDGMFNPNRMIELVRNLCTQALNDGYVGVRGTGETSWWLEDIPGAKQLLEYEAQLNDICQSGSLTAVCQYDARRLDGAVLLNVLRVHPMMIVHGQIVRNPYYVRPEQFLRDFGSTGGADG
jgi:hypothetical protein